MVEIKAILANTSKGLVEIGIIIGVIIFNMDHSFKREVFINLCTALLVLGAAAGFFVVFNHLNSKQNNKPNAVAIGYIVIAILLMLKLYYDELIINGAQIGYSKFKVQLIIDLLEVAYIIIGIKYVDQYTNIKKYIALSAAILTVSVLVSYRTDFLNSKLTSVFDGVTIDAAIRIALIVLTVIFIFILYKDKNEPCKINRYRVLFILILHVVYQSGYLFFRIQHYLIGEAILGMMKLAVYSNILSLIHDGTLCIMWQSRDEDLENKTKKLAEDIKQRDTLIIVSEKLQGYVKEISKVTSGFKESLQTSKDLKKLKYADMITQNCYRLNKLTHNIGSINQIEKGDILPCFIFADIALVVRRLIESTEPYASSMHIQIKLIEPKGPINCYVDTELIERVMLNLISNAIKYNKENGSVTIYVNTKKDNVYICVKDTGLGIPYSKLSAIFNRYERGDYTISNRREGSGLGLPIVKSLIEIHKGSICMVSKEGHGTTVSIEFPKYREASSKVCCHAYQDKKELDHKVQIELSDLKI